MLADCVSDLSWNSLSCLSDEQIMSDVEELIQKAVMEFLEIRRQGVNLGKYWIISNVTVVYKW